MGLDVGTCDTLERGGLMLVVVGFSAGRPAATRLPSPSHRRPSSMLSQDSHSTGIEPRRMQSYRQFRSCSAQATRLPLLQL